jgi:hypothetical protein
MQKRERGPGGRDLALPLFDVQASGGDHPKHDEPEGRTDKIDPKAATYEHAGEAKQGRGLGQAHPDEESRPIRASERLRRPRHERSPTQPRHRPERVDAQHCDRPRHPSLASAVPGAMKLIAKTKRNSETRKPRSLPRRTISPFVSLRHHLALITSPRIGIRYHQSPRRDGHQPGSSGVIVSLCFGLNPS